MAARSSAHGEAIPIRRDTAGLIPLNTGDATAQWRAASSLAPEGSADATGGRTTLDMACSGSRIVSAASLFLDLRRSLGAQSA